VLVALNAELDLGITMKAKPVKFIYGVGYSDCEKEDATHLTLNMPSPTGKLTLPVITSGSRKDTGCWTWNGDTEKPTLRPSILTESHLFRCHSFVNDGVVQFLGDCSHDKANTTVELLDVI